MTAKKGSGRHTTQCSVCRHPQREQIESEYVDWEHQSEILKKYGGFSRQSLWKHIQYFELDKKLARNIRGGLLKLAKGYRPPKSGYQDGYLFMNTLERLAKTNSKGEFVERIETISRTEIINSLTAEEQDSILDHIRQTGTLPDWIRPLLLGDPQTEKTLKGRKVI